MSKIANLAAGLALALLVPASHAASADLTRYNAPDAVSRAILSHHVRFEDGALTPRDLPAAIHRNYPMIIEQNLARMDAAHSSAWVDQLSDAELRDIAQLYTNANADAHRTGPLLLVAANRMDGAHLARLSKFFGYAPIYDAILKAAPTKAQSFAQHAPIAFDAPVAGLLTPLEFDPTAAPSMTGTSMMGATVIGAGLGGPIIAQFSPNVGMTLREIYMGFRGEYVGESAASAALYETTVFAGVRLYAAWEAGYQFGTFLTSLAQTYAPNWYYGTFVNWVGQPVDWLQSTVTTMGSYGNAIVQLGNFEQSSVAPFAVPSAALQDLSNYGGDNGVTDAWTDNAVGSGKCGYDPGENCNTN